MIRFECDYAEGAHPLILERLVATNFVQTPGYGEDVYCENARNIIKSLCGNENLDIHFLVGGTQTNTTVIASALRPHQAVVAAKSGHVNVHETGAIESTGHKVMTVESSNGKITASQVREVYKDHLNDPNFEHTVQPKMIYISQSTECGTVYTKSELEEISKACKECSFYLFVDGARLGYALASLKQSYGEDMSLKDLSELCDVFYIGGTKVGALFGEAVVISNKNLKNDFRYIMKQRGAMLAKGRLLGIQFSVLFEDGLYFKISEHAVKMAHRIRDAFVSKGFNCAFESPSNQQFFILPDEVVEKLQSKYKFEFWARHNENSSVVRVCTCWATKEEDVEALVSDIKKLAI
ncbi:MAG: low specificity L-threonine aldolase [Candidatus Riflebacteria bacterium]|nr:low specificity L-threonine aldolase [Candidatus Riflebacteria bacterium]